MNPPPLPPPQGCLSWLDYAVTTMETRCLFNDHRWGHQPQWPAAVEREDFRVAAQSELAQLREFAWAACPGVERVDGVWVFAGTEVPVAHMFEALSRGGIMLDEWRSIFCPDVAEEQIQAAFACVRRSLYALPPVA